MDAPFIDDNSLADAGTATELLRQKFPGLFASAAPANPTPGPIVPATTAVDPNSIPAPDVTPPAAPFVLPWLRQFQSQPARPPISTPSGQWTPGDTKAEKLEVLLRNGLQGAIAGAGASANAVVQSGGRRSGGFGLGAAAGFAAPAQQTAMQQSLERGGLENQVLQNQVQVAPALNFLKLLQGQAELGKTGAEATRAQAQADAERYKVDGGILYDLKAPNGPAPIQGSAAGQFIPASPAMAAVAGVPVGAMIQAATATKLQELVNNAPPSNADQINAGFLSRYQILNPGKSLPDAFTFKPGMSQADYKRIDSQLQANENAAATKAQRDTVNSIRSQTAALAQQSALDREQKQGLTWVTGQDASGRTVAGPLSMAVQQGWQNPAQLDTRDVQGVMDARQAINLINKKGDPNKPATWGVDQLIDSLEKDGKLGVAASRLNSFLTGSVGFTPGDDPRIISLLDKSQLLMTLSMKAHFGASGGRSPQMLEHFLALANAKKMDAPTLRAGTAAVGDYMEDRAMIPGGNAAPNASSDTQSSGNHPAWFHPKQ